MHGVTLTVERAFDAIILRCRLQFARPSHSVTVKPGLILLLLVTLICGCSGASQPKSPSGETNKSGAIADTAPERSDDQGKAGNRSASTMSVEPVAADADSTSATAESPSAEKIPQVVDAQARPTTTAGNKVQGDQAVPSPPAAEPLPEQLASWTRTPFEPLQMLECFEGDNTGYVTCMANTPDGRHFIVAGNKLTLWSITSTTPEHVFLDLVNSDKSLCIKSLAVSPDGQWFAAGDSEGLMRIWSIADRKELISKQIYGNDIIQIAISPDSDEIATATYTNEVTIWSADKLEQKNHFKVEASGLQRIAYLSPKLLVAAAETTTTWDAATGTLDETLSPGGYNYTLKRSPKGKWFVFGDREGLQLWNISKANREATLSGSFASDELAEFSPDEQFLATASKFEIRMWDIASRQVVQVIDAYGSSTVALNWLPESHLLLIATEDGRIRVWGTPAAGEPYHWRPLQAAIELPDTLSREPLTPVQLMQTIDLRSFPGLPGSVPKVYGITDVAYEVPVKEADAKLFYRFFLGRSGWSEVPPAATSSASLEFRKNGCLLSASLSNAGESRTTVNLNHSGNYDLRWAPKCDAAPVELVFENEQAVIYRTKADLTQIEVTLLRTMHEAGWTAYSRLNSSHNEQPDARDMEFLRGSTILRVSIGKFPADPSSYTVQYSKFLTANSLPIPQDSGFIEFDGSTQPYLVAMTSMNLAQTRAFYEQEMLAQGWLAREIGRSVKDDQCWLPFIQGQRDLRIGLASQPHGRTLVRVGENLENSSWQLARPQPTVEATTVVAGLEAADFPVLSQSKSAHFNANDKSIEFQMGAVSLSDVADQYTKELQSKGWSTEDAGIRSDDYLFLTFHKDEAEIELRARVSSGNATVNVQGDGILWTKPLPGGKQVISYEAWLRQNRYPAGLERLDQYQAEMRSISAEEPTDGK